MNIMTRHAAWALSATLGLGLFAATPASAQAVRTFVSGLGDDVNPCSRRTAPCKTFAGAISKTTTSGEINCLDPASYGAVSIGKSITIRCNYTEGGILSSNGTGVSINAPGATVVLIGLDLEGIGQGSVPPGINGVDILNANVVHIRDSHIRGFRGGQGILFRPQNGNATVHLIVDNVVVSESGSVTGAGIAVLPVAGAKARLTFTNSQVVNSGPIGLRLDTQGSDNGMIIATIDNSVFSDDNAAILVRATAGTSTIQLMLTNSLLTHNKADGILVNGGPAVITARVANTIITANDTGIAYGAAGGELRTLGDNLLYGNRIDGAFTGPPLVRQ